MANAVESCEFVVCIEEIDDTGNTNVDAFYSGATTSDPQKAAFNAFKEWFANAESDTSFTIPLRLEAMVWTRWTRAEVDTASDPGHRYMLEIRGGEVAR